METRALQEEAIRQAERTIRAVVGKLVNSSHIRESDADDLAQILRIHVSERAERHDPARSSLKTFIERIVENKLRDHLEERFADGRDERRIAASLDELRRTDDGAEEPLGGLIDVEDALRRAGMKPWEPAPDLVMDVRDALDDLSAIERETCAAIAATRSLREAADDLDIHVETLRDRVERIRGRFKRRGIHGSWQRAG